MKTIYKTLTICGDHVELMEYPNGVQTGKRNKVQPVKCKNKQKEIRFDSLFRTKKKLRRLIWSNEGYLKTFATLTFRDEIIDLKTANKHFQDFIKRMNYRFDYFMYICVPEFQKRGVVHYHMLTNIPYIANEDMSNLWTWGFVNIKSISKVKNISYYLTKYLSKTSSGGDERFFNKKKIFYSKNIRKPETIKDRKEINAYLEYFNPALKLVCEKEVKMEFVGDAVYKLYEIKPDHAFKETTEEEFKELMEMLLKNLEK